MFCHRCGTSIPDGTAVCPNCKTILSDNQTPNRDVRPQPGMEGTPNYGMPLPTDRNIVVFFALNLVTCGIYSYFFLYSLIQDVNIVCKGDGDETPGLLLFIVLSIITCGIYSIIWWYSLADRLYLNARRYGLFFTENGTTVLLWFILGIFLCTIGPWVGMHIVFKNTNALCAAYNREHGMA